ncbi:facilitated trehalose transporter Tret1-like isoform X1 [Phymastichus coffea]|uniref:facilitated trehalose transporter Tret1-like isoform X1 n=1 Tax=Phymastichus coffea TaxID=108790 RepID=UPI00273ADE89|nr:facilitated trehalose transporter Tret1-like isoform X1 [Phymastichus coffea]
MKLFSETNKSSLIQWIATFAVFLLSCQIGLFTGWVSPNEARLSQESPSSQSEISWVISLAPVGSALGALAGAFSIEYLGSRKTVLLTYLLMGINWVCVLCANSFVWLYFARFIGGVAETIYICSFSMYLSEVTAPKIRGTLISVSMSGGILGVILGLIAETYLTKIYSCPIYLTVTLLGILLVQFLKDTPYYFVKVNDMEGAKNSIIFYRANVDAEKELREIKDYVESSSKSTGNKFCQLRLPTVRKSLFIIVIVYALPELSGASNLLSYTESILTNVGFDLIKPEQGVIYINVISITSMLLIFRGVDKLGRKVSLLISSVGTSIAMVALGSYYYLLNSDFDVSNLHWLPIVSMVAFLILYNVGYLTVPNTLLSEIFSEDMKSVAACLGTLSTSFFGFVINKSFQPIISSLGYHIAFWIHAALTLIGIPCALWLLTETKGKSLQQIQDKLNRK